MHQHRGFFQCDWVYKPGSVLTAIYLVAQLLTRSSRLLGTIGPIVCSSTALLRIEFTALQCSHGAGGLLHRLFTLTPCGAVSLCCTCPEVTLGGRYPLSLPCEARTFLTWRFSASSRGCPTQLQVYFTLFCFDCQTSCKMFLKRIYYKWIRRERRPRRSV